MLGGARLKIVFTHEKTCFAYISAKYSSNKEQNQCIQVLSKERTIYLWGVFSASIPEGQIACNPIHSKLLGLEEGAEVFVSPYSGVKVLDELNVDPDSPDDQEILERNVDHLQLRILDQLRLVVAHQKAIVWIFASMPIVFTPKQTGILVNQSRIIVKMDVFSKYQGLQKPPDTMPEAKETLFKSIAKINEEMLRPYLNIPKKLVLRAIPIDSDGKKNLIHPYTVFMHEELIEEKYKDATVILATMNNISDEQQPPKKTEVDDDSEPDDSNSENSIKNNSKNDSTNNSNQIEDLCVEIVPVNNIVFRSLCREIYNKCIPTVLIPKSLNAIINIENGVRIILTFIGDKVEQPEHIDVVTYSDQVQSETEVIDKFKNCVITNTHSGKKFLINSKMIKQNTEITKGHLQFKLKPENLKYTMLNSESFRDCSVSAKCLPDTELVLPKPAISKLEYNNYNYCRTIKSLETLVEKVMSHIYFEIHRDASFRGASEIKSNILVTGSTGTGKTTLCHIVQKELTVWSEVLYCRPLKGSKDILNYLQKVIGECQARSPAVLICDDFDSLVPPNAEGLSPQDVAFYQRLAGLIKYTLQSCTGVCVLMTSCSMKSLHPVLRQFTGKPMFTAHFSIPELEQEERAELFKYFVGDKMRAQVEVGDGDVTKMAADTGGHSARELADYFNRRLFRAVKKKKRGESKPRLVEDVLKDEEKAIAFDVWGAVGGLDDVKQTLTECIFWPLMYPALFPSQSCGVLLYGPPGTGKSHIGSCLARLHNMRMITVKGPELLSKYIGQSEAAVREVFDKADMQRPCILFFDEFDSLAPKRGHDSTGVTDRVVNQLLARLDGAEGGARGPVLCASSRPDLLDPALLRAGRLSTHVRTRLPDQAERAGVLRALSASVALAGDVCLARVAAATDGYSPADLKALLVTAQLARLETHLASKEAAPGAVVVCQADVDGALRDTRPSLSRDQRTFYDMIYKRFRGEPLNAAEQAMADRQQRQRVTLA